MEREEKRFSKRAQQLRQLRNKTQALAPLMTTLKSRSLDFYMSCFHDDITLASFIFLSLSVLVNSLWVIIHAVNLMGCFICLRHRKIPPEMSQLVFTCKGRYYTQKNTQTKTNTRKAPEEWLARIYTTLGSTSLSYISRDIRVKSQKPRSSMFGPTPEMWLAASLLVDQLDVNAYY